MKPYLTTLIIFCCLFNQVLAQSPSASIDSLVKFKVVTAKEVPIIKRELKSNRRNDSYRVAILSGLQYLMLQKTFHLDPHKTGISYSYSFTFPKNQVQDSINTSLSRLLENIRKADLLSSRIYIDTKKAIDSGLYVAEVQLIDHLLEMSSRLEWLAPAKLLPFAEQLHANGIVSDTSFLRLHNDIKNNKIEWVSQLAGYCNLARTLDLASYPDDPDLWLKRMHQDIAAILPGLDFSNFKYATIPDTSFSIPGVKFKVSLTCNGHVYKHTSLPISNLKSKGGKITPKDIFAEDFHRIFNKVLTDQASPYRLHSLMFGGGSYRDDRFGHFSLIALTDIQARVFMKDSIFSYMSVSIDDYDSTITSAKIDSLITGWKKLGLFANLSSAVTDQAVDDAEAADPFSIADLLSNFPGVIYELRDAFTATRRPYGYLLTSLAKITRGAFNPTKIIQSKMNHGLRLQYLFRGKAHS